MLALIALLVVVVVLVFWRIQGAKHGETGGRVYALHLNWADAADPGLRPGNKEVFACASVSAQPPLEAADRLDALAAKISLRVEGPNHEWVRLCYRRTRQQGPYVVRGALWIPVTVFAPAADAALEPGDPDLVAALRVGEQHLEQRLKLRLQSGGIQDGGRQDEKRTGGAIFSEGTGAGLAGWLKPFLPPGSAAETPQLLRLPDGRAVPLSGSLSVGCDGDNDVCLADEKLSRRHAVIEFTPAGWQVRDLGSTNGVWVNGRRIAGAQLLRPGDVIELGSSRLRVE